MTGKGQPYRDVPLCKCPHSMSFCSLFDLVNNFNVTLVGSSRALKCNKRPFDQFLVSTRARKERN